MRTAYLIAVAFLIWGVICARRARDPVGANFGCAIALLAVMAIGVIIAVQLFRLALR